MGLTIVIGDRSAGKTGVLYERVRDAARRGLSAAVLLPTIPERERALRELCTSLPVGVSIETMDAFLDGLWNTLGDGRRRISEIERLVVLEEVVDRLGSLVSEAIPRSAAMRILPVLVQRAAEQPIGVQHAAASDPQARALAAAIAAYHEEIAARGLIEEAAARTAAAEAVTRDALPDVVCINRFETFTPPQMAFIESAARADTDVMVALTYVHGSDATRAVTGLLERLQRLPGTQTVEVLGSPPGSAEEMRALQSSLARGSRDAIATGAVRLVAALGLRGEAEAAAAAAAEMVDTGIPAEEIAVVARGMSRRARRLGAALEAAGIPWCYEGTWHLRDSGLGRAVVSLVRLVAEGRRDHLASFLQSGYAGLSHEEADGFLRDVRARRTPHGVEMRREAERAPGEAGRLLREAFAAFDAREGAFAVEALQRIADRMLRNRHGVSPVLDRDGRLDARARQAVLDAASAVLEAKGRLDAASLARVLEQARIPADEGPAAGVVVTSTERVRARRFDAVIALGLTGDEFPRVDAGLGLPRRTTHDLERLGIDAAPRAGLDDERLLFYQAVTGARRRLVLVWQAVDDDGNEKDPSLFVDELLDAYEPGRGPQIVQSRADAPALAPGTGVSRSQVGTPRSAPRAVLHGTGHGLPEDVAEELARRTAFSASELEAYLRCPRRWFYERELRPAGIDVEIDARERGRVAHRILQRFYEAWKEMGNARVTPALLARALEVHAKVADEVVQSEPPPESLDEQAEMDRAVVGTRRVLERDAVSFEGFAPVAHEIAFGVGESGAVELDGWQLRGRIDRIDAGEAGLIVCDYKTGGGVSAARFEEDRILQAPLYSYAAAKLYDQPVVGMIYRTMSVGQDRGAYLPLVVSSPWLAAGDARDAQGIEALIARAVERAAEAVKGIRSGNVRPEPYQDQACASCIARTWCEGSRA